MKTERFVEPGQQVRRKRSDPRTDALHVDRPNLFGLSFRVAIESSRWRGQEHLKRIDAFGVRGDRHDGDDASPDAFGSAVCAIVAHDDGGAPLVGFGSSRRLQVNEADLASTHYVNPSLEVTAHSSESSPTDHSAHASS